MCTLLRVASSVESSLYALPYYLVQYRCRERAEDRNRILQWSYPYPKRPLPDFLHLWNIYQALQDLEATSERMRPPGGFLIVCVDESNYVVNR